MHQVSHSSYNMQTGPVYEAGAFLIDFNYSDSRRAVCICSGYLSAMRISPEGLIGVHGRPALSIRIVLVLTLYTRYMQTSTDCMWCKMHVGNERSIVTMAFEPVTAECLKQIRGIQNTYQLNAGKSTWANNTYTSVYKNQNTLFYPKPKSMIWI